MDSRAQDCRPSPIREVACANKLKDVSDSQYGTFRKNIPYMAMLLMFHPLLRRVYNTIIYPLKATGQSRPTPEEADARLNQRASFDFGFALIYLVALHGVSAAKVLLILYLNYQRRHAHLLIIHGHKSTDTSHFNDTNPIYH